MEVKKLNMKKEKAEQIVSEYMNQIFSYVSKRVSNEQDRYDLVQNICLQLYHSFCILTIYLRQPFAASRSSRNKALQFMV